MLTDFKCGMIMIGGYVFSGFFAAAITMFLSMLIGTDNILICHIIVAVAWSVGAFIGTKKLYKAFAYEAGEDEYEPGFTVLRFLIFWGIFSVLLFLLGWGEFEFMKYIYWESTAIGSAVRTAFSLQSGDLIIYLTNILPHIYITVLLSIAVNKGCKAGYKKIFADREEREKSIEMKKNEELEERKHTIEMINNSKEANIEMIKNNKEFREKE